MHVKQEQSRSSSKGGGDVAQVKLIPLLAVQRARKQTTSAIFECGTKHVIVTFERSGARLNAKSDQIETASWKHGSKGCGMTNNSSLNKHAKIKFSKSTLIGLLLISSAYESDEEMALI